MPSSTFKPSKAGEKKYIVQRADTFDTLSAEEKQHIIQKAGSLVEPLKKWASGYTVIRPIRIPMSALSTAIAFATVIPPMPPVECVLLSKLGLWTFGVDDVTDGRKMPLAEFERKVETWCSIASLDTDTIDDNHDLTTMILEVKNELSKHRLFGSLCRQWSFSTRIFLEGIAQEYRHALDHGAGRLPTLPTLEEYLRYSIGSIGVFVWSFTAFIILDDLSIREQLEPISEALRYTSLALRLYNDLQTFDKEIEEGKINSIVIKYHAMLNKDPNTTKGSALAQAKQCVLQLANSYAQKCYELTEQIETDTGQIERIIYRLVAFHAYFYSQHDYHTTPLTTLQEIFDA